MKKIVLLICVTLLMLMGCNENPKSRFVKVQGTHIVSPDNQSILLRSINVVNKRKEDNLVARLSADAYKDIKNQGFNCIRLGMYWSALEPQPLQYDQTYLTQLDSQIKLIKEQGMYIVLDMHQDLYGLPFGGGAPSWATLDEGKIHTPGEVTWSDAYYDSEAVQVSFDNFWINKEVPASKMGVQEHYARLWKLIAQRYVDEPAIVGFDIMNEPFVGSEGPLALQSMFMKVTEMMPSLTIESILESWSSPGEKDALFAELTNIDVYKAIMQAPEAIYQNFEKTKLQPFYQHIADSIRTVNSNHILFLEPSVSANNGVLSVLEPTKMKNGEYDELTVFAPHFYDIVMDSDLAATADSERLSFIIDQIKQAANKINRPVWIGEWGAFYNCKDCSSAARTMTELMNSNFIGNAYWDYQGKDWDLNHFQVMQTVSPQKVNGRLTSFTNTDAQSIITWKQESGSDQSIIYIPNVKNVKSIDVNPKLEYNIQDLDGSQSGLLTIYGNSGNEVKLTVNF